MVLSRPLERLEPILLVGIGGFAGSNLRYFVDSVVDSSLLSTATVNVIGCIALGFILYEDVYGDSISQPARTLFATGFISSFTTYSTFVVDALSTTPIVASGYIVGSYATGFAGVVLGREGARRVAAVQPAAEVDE